LRGYRVNRNASGEQGFGGYCSESLDFPEALDVGGSFVDGLAVCFDPSVRIGCVSGGGDADDHLGGQALAAHPPAKGQGAGQAGDAGDAAADAFEGQGAALPEG